MEEVRVRRAKESDIEMINKLLYQVLTVHSNIRPDLFKPGTKKYSDDELRQMIAYDDKPIFVAEKDGIVLGYAFCVYQKHTGNNTLTDIKTLYIDDLCVDEAARNMHIGRLLYHHVIEYAKQNGFYNITLNVWTGNDNAIRFYEKMGLKVQKMGMEKIL